MTGRHPNVTVTLQLLLSDILIFLCGVKGRAGLVGEILMGMYHRIRIFCLEFPDKLEKGDLLLRSSCVLWSDAVKGYPSYVAYTYGVGVMACAVRSSDTLIPALMHGTIPVYDIMIAYVIEPPLPMPSPDVLHSKVPAIRSGRAVYYYLFDISHG